AGTVVGPWRVVNWRGQGSYGVVYLAEPARQEGGRRVALKLALHAGDERFEREVELLSRLRHPNVPRLLDAGTWTAPEGTSFPFLVMEWVEGVPLYEWAPRHKLTSRQAMKLLAQVGRALAATHEVEGVHRDVKGDNVLVAEDGRAVLMDFGSGCYRGARVLTHPKAPVGTPRYWSPESQLFQYRFGRHASARYEPGPADDVYALGVVGYRLVTGEYPPEALLWEEEGEGPRLASSAHVRPEERVTVLPELAALIRRMLSEQPSERGRAEEVAQALEEAQKAAGRRANRRIVALRGRAPVERTPRPEALRSAVAWLGWATAVSLGVALAIRGGPPGHEVPKDEPVQVAGASRRKGGGTSALAEESLAAREEPAKPEAARGIRREVPKKPLPDQRHPPCGRHEAEIHGGCWARLAGAQPPCEEHYYKWKDGCYLPVPATARVPTSEQP
ncbi:MAG TPA: serine/threonine-protein kinase, partial [Archangium sp.]|nr:serine/threonine-protein kinase [Archangium sp.]